MCPETVGDPLAAPWGVGNLTLAVCDPGLCTSIPDINASEYLAMGGNAGNLHMHECVQNRCALSQLTPCHRPVCCSDGRYLDQW